MAISRQSFTGPTAGAVPATSFTDVAYNPGYGGTEKCRMVLITIWNFSGLGGAIATINGGGITYGGARMHVAAGALIGNGGGAWGIWYIVNPPTGAQNIVYTSLGGQIGNVNRSIIALESDTDTGLRIAQAKTVITTGATTSSALFTTTATAAYMVAASGRTANNQTVTAGTPLGGDGTTYAVVDSNGEVTAGTSTGITTTTAVNNTFNQVVAVITPHRRGAFWFFE